MAMAKPIIASDLDQIGEILKNGSPVDEQKNAILVKPGSVDDLAAAIKDVLTRDDLSILARNSFDLAVKKYTWERHVEHILSELSHVV
jgi:glycosyltransferase involved in cell wall biosynthesis